MIAFAQVKVPIFTVLMRRSFGVAGNNYATPLGRASVRVAWPAADVGGIPPEGGIEAAYKRQLAEAADPAALRAEIEARIESVRGPLGALSRFQIEEMIDPAAQGVTGWGQAEAAGKKLDEVFKIVDEKELIPVESPMAETIPKRVVTNLIAPVLLITKNGEKVPVEDSAAPMIDEKAELTGAVMVFRDITERKNAENAIKTAFDSLEERVREQTAELRTSFEKLGRAMEGTIQALATMVEARDRYTAGHQGRVAGLACSIARRVGVIESRSPKWRVLHNLRE